MTNIHRRTFLKNSIKLSFGVPLISTGLKLNDEFNVIAEGNIMTVNGIVKASELGFTLSHEHILVDFIGADNYDPKRWNHNEVIRVVTPYLELQPRSLISSI